MISFWSNVHVSFLQYALPSSCLQMLIFPRDFAVKSMASVRQLGTNVKNQFFNHIKQRNSAQQILHLLFDPITEFIRIFRSDNWVSGMHTQNYIAH